MIDKWYADESDRVYRADEVWRVLHRDHHDKPAVFNGGRDGYADCGALADYLNEHDVPYAEVAQKQFEFWRHLLQVTLKEHKSIRKTCPDIIDWWARIYQWSNYRFYPGKPVMYLGRQI